MNNIYHYPNKQRKLDAGLPAPTDSADTRAIDEMKARIGSGVPAAGGILRSTPPPCG